MNVQAQASSANDRIALDSYNSAAKLLHTRYGVQRSIGQIPCYIWQVKATKYFLIEALLSRTVTMKYYFSLFRT
ncbi:hypothetical protein LENED_010892 [Lentinula edodes]|uniref:Uncharacterized protein n=1 Tax=Lentinula edodes TaxID=5353 RepID=A0A1Q3ENL6_LENED|nr:hypothetical protein LENED_010892 [Lentinula edodes]